MSQFTAKSAALLLVTITLSAVLMQACGGGGDAHAQSAIMPDPMEGSLQSTVALKDCTSGAALTGFRGLSIFNQDGAVNADNNRPSATKGPAMGTWKRSGTGTYVVELRVWRYGSDGRPAGPQRLTRTVTLAADGKSLTSNITTQALDPADNVVLTACGTETGARIG